MAENEAANVVKEFFTKLDTRDFSGANALLADTFLFGGWSPRPLTREEFIRLVEGMADGMPDLQFNLHDLNQTDQGATGAFRITGVHTIDMNLPPLSLPPISETNNRVSMPSEPFNAIVRDGIIIEIIVHHVPSGGANGFIRQLGIDVSIIQP